MENGFGVLKTLSFFCFCPYQKHIFIARAVKQKMAVYLYPSIRMKIRLVLVFLVWRTFYFVNVSILTTGNVRVPL